MCRFSLVQFVGRGVAVGCSAGLSGIVTGDIGA